MDVSKKPFPNTQETMTAGQSTITSSIETSETTALIIKASNKVRRDATGSTKARDANFWWLFGCIMFGSLLAFFDGTIMASGHPVITSYFKASNAASWLTTMFFLASTVSQPLYGRISDVLGRRSVLLFAFSMFFISNACCALAQNMATFIAARFLCGIGAGGMTTMTVILISDVVELEYRGIYQSYYNVAWGCGNGLGAALGGLLCDSLGWRAAFGVQLPFIFADAVVAYFVVPSDLGPCLSKTEGKTVFETLQDMDIPGSVALTITVACLILGINLGGNVFPWNHPIVIASLTLFVVALCSLVQIERRPIKRPILPLAFLSSFPVANLMWSNLLSAIVINTIIFNVPIFLQAVRQVSPTTSGLYLIAPLVAASITGTFAGVWITWTRKMKPLMVVGALFFVLGAAGVTCLDLAIPPWAISMLISGASIGQGLNWPPTTIALLALNSQGEQAVVSTTQGLLRYIGSILGVAISSWIFQNALTVFLNQNVTGLPEEAKQKFIQEIRKSIEAIALLDPRHKIQVIDAYCKSLRITFGITIVVALVVNLLTWPVDLPPLRRRETKIMPESQSSEGEGDE